MKRFLQRNQSPIAALGISVALTLWLLSGTGATGSARDPSLEAPRVHRPAVTRVRVKTMESQRVIREVIIYGKTEAARSVTLRAEIDGRVTDIGAKRGAHVKKGELIVQLDVRDLQARLQQSRALVYQRKIQYDAAERLKSKNYQSQTNVAEARADLEAARAAAKRVEVEISNSVVAGGLTFATLLTLVLTPSLLVLGERLKFGRRNTAQARLPESTSALQERA